MLADTEIHCWFSSTFVFDTGTLELVSLALIVRLHTDSEYCILAVLYPTWVSLSGKMHCW